MSRVWLATCVNLTTYAWSGRDLGGGDGGRGHHYLPSLNIPQYMGRYGHPTHRSPHNLLWDTASPFPKALSWIRPCLVFITKHGLTITFVDTSHCKTQQLLCCWDWFFIIWCSQSGYVIVKFAIKYPSEVKHLLYKHHYDDFLYFP